MAHQIPLFLPDRFDTLRRKSTDLKGIIVPVKDGLDHIDAVFVDMTSAGRGQLVIFKGDSGSGKSTFLQTIALFRESTVVEVLSKTEDISNYLANIRTPSKDTDLQVIVVEGREALTDTSDAEIEKALHAINSFVRSEKGERTIVAWPCNTAGLEANLIQKAVPLGAEALLGGKKAAYHFPGPPQASFYDIASKTIHVLNQGASISDLGVSEEHAKALALTCSTIGSYLLKLRGELSANSTSLKQLLAKEQCKVWIVVCAGNEPEGDVAALTRGSYSTIDIDRITTATEANVVLELRKIPEKLGILGNVLDAKILHLPIITALSLMREHADDPFREEMTKATLNTTKDGEALKRITESDLASAFRGNALGTRTTGGGPGSNTKDAFLKLATLSAKNDIQLNRCIAEGLKAAGLISDYKLEADLGTGMARRTDIYCTTATGPVRLEFMWRSKTGRADIANYTLTKLNNYGKAIGFLD